MAEFKYDRTIELLTARTNEIRQQLQGDNRPLAVKKADQELYALVELKTQLENSVKLLIFCKKYGITPNLDVKIIPRGGSDGYFTDFSIIDACCEVREHWNFVEINGEQVELHMDDLVICKHC